MAITTQNQKGISKKNKELIDSVKKFEDAKEYNTIKFAETLWEIRKDNAQTAAGFTGDMEGFKDFCGTYLNTGYHTAMRYIAIHKMVVNCAIDPAVAEDLGYSKLRTIASVAQPDNIGMLLEKARDLTIHELEEFIKGYRNSPNPDSEKDDPQPLFKKFIFPASQEEVPIITACLADVKTLLNNQNDTNALIHALQGYMEFAYPNERAAAIGELRKPVDEKSKTKESKKSKPETVVAEPVVEPVISEDMIHRASLPELLAFAKANNISIEEKIVTSKPKVKAQIIDVLAERAIEEDADEVNLPEESEVAEDLVEVVEDSVDPEIPPVVSDKKSKKAPKEKPAKAEKAPKAEKAEKKKPVEVEEIPDPADTDGEEANITVEQAIAEIRNVTDKKQLKEVAESYGIGIDDDEMEMQADVLVEKVVEEFCAMHGEKYLPPADDSDLEDMLNGK